MTTRKSISSFGRPLGFASCALIALALGAPLAPAQTGAQKRFENPEQAIGALASAAKAHDKQTIAQILGPKAKDLASGDEVRDTMDRNVFAELVSEKVTVERLADTRAQFVIGSEEWPFAIPVVSEGGSWRFDTEAGIDEVLSRRIGANEIGAILACRAYAVAQWEYLTTGDWDKDGLGEYALRFRSSPGARDGLYWPTAKSEDPSPLGNFVATAESVGYKAKTEGDPRLSAPLVGYRFKILTRQGAHAPGGTFSYVINKNMIAGFALVAYPVSWGNSGVMTFMVNQQGRVYEKDLGPNTATIASQIEVYDPDQTWALADEDVDGE